MRKKLNLPLAPDFLLDAAQQEKFSFPVSQQEVPFGKQAFDVEVIRICIIEVPGLFDKDEPVSKSLRETVLPAGQVFQTQG